MMTILLFQSALAWEVQTTEGGAEYHWHEMPLDYVWVDDGAPRLDELDRAIVEAFDAWSEVPDTRIEVLGHDRPNALGQVALDDDHVVYFESEWPLGSEALAVATTWADDQGRVVSFDVRINANVSWSTTGDDARFDLQAAMTHEVGHVLGLEHSAFHDATMFPSHDVGDTWRQALHEDDQEAVQYLYELGGGGAGPGAATACNTATGTAWAWLLPFTLVAHRRRRSSC